jgi:hypothetical protein
LTVLLQAKSCRTCKFSEALPTGALECRHGPPIGGPVVVPVKQGVLQVQMHCGFPSVLPDQFCYQYVPRLAIAANAMPWSPPPADVIDLDPFEKAV